MPERPKGADCKSAGVCLRRFKSFSRHCVSCPATSRRFLPQVGPLPHRGPCGFLPGDISSLPPAVGAPAPPRAVRFLATCDSSSLFGAPAPPGRTSLPHRGPCGARRHLVASSRSWGPCPTAGRALPGGPLNRGPCSWGPCPTAGRAVSCPATSRRFLPQLGPLPHRGCRLFWGVRGGPTCEPPFCPGRLRSFGLNRRRSALVRMWGANLPAAFLPGPTSVLRAEQTPVGPPRQGRE